MGYVVPFFEWSGVDCVLGRCPFTIRLGVLGYGHVRYAALGVTLMLEPVSYVLGATLRIVAPPHGPHRREPDGSRQAYRPTRHLHRSRSRPRRTDKPGTTSRWTGALACVRVRAWAAEARHDADHGRPRRQRNAAPKNGVQRVLRESAPSKLGRLTSCPRRAKNKIALSAGRCWPHFRVSTCLPMVYGTPVS